MAFITAKWEAQKQEKISSSEKTICFINNFRQKAKNLFSEFLFFVSSLVMVLSCCFSFSFRNKSSGNTSQKSAFTIVEIAIVLVIIGLLSGTVLAGRDMIKSAEIRSVIKDIDTYKTAVYTFRNKYNCIPGDCPNATAFWGAENATPATCQTTASYGSLTCDGDGNGMIWDATYEMFRFWQHLAIAGLIKGQYTGVVGSGGVYDHRIGINAPATAIYGVGFSMGYKNLAAGGDGATYGMNYGNTFFLGIENHPWRTENAFFTPADAYSFDSKIDDGKPGTGYVIARSPLDAWTTTNACTTSTSYSDFTGDYKTTVSSKVCSFMIKSGL